MYFFLKRTRCLILEPGLETFYLKKEDSCNFVKWALNRAVRSLFSVFYFLFLNNAETICLFIFPF